MFLNETVVFKTLYKLTETELETAMLTLALALASSVDKQRESHGEPGSSGNFR